MNTHDKYELPPLPEMPVLSFDNFALCYHQMKQYGEQCAREAIEADRQARGEPVAWYLPSADGYDSMFRDHATVKSCTGNPWDGWLPLYTAAVSPHPQQIPEGYNPTKLNIGVSATAEGAAICIMKTNADGTVTVIYSGIHPLGESLGCAMLEVAPESKGQK